MSLYILPNSAVVQKLSEIHQFYVIVGIVVLLFVTLAVVALLTFFRPRHLSAEMAKALEKSEQLREFVESKAFADLVLDIVEQKAVQTGVVQSSSKRK